VVVAMGVRTALTPLLRQLRRARDRPGNRKAPKPVAVSKQRMVSMCPWCGAIG
jgi:hypothetical protein